MKQMNKFAGFVGVLAMVAVAPLARADYNLSVNNVDCAKAASATPNIVAACLVPVTPIAGVTVTILSTQGTQAPTFSEQLSSTVSVMNNNAGSETITFGAGITNFTSPTIPPFTGINDASSITLDETRGGATGTLVSCVDQANSLAPPDGSCTDAPGMAGPNPAVTVTGAQTNGNTVFGNITALSAPFSLQQVLTLTLKGNTSLNFTLTQILTPVPEPASLVLFGSTLLGAGLFFRRKLQSKRG